MKKVVLPIFLCCISFFGYSQEEVIADTTSVDSVQMLIDNLEANLRFQDGKIELGDGIGALNVPKGFKYLDPQDTKTVLEILWGNPEADLTLGMIFPEGMKPSDFTSYGFIIEFESMGYVKDDDADDIDYDDLLEEMRGDMEASNEARIQGGFEPMALVGWASTPYYDAEKKVLHWAKELKFGESEDNTLNYNIRVLGRKGVLVFNAVAPMSQLAAVKEDINPMLSSFEFASGNKYSDFDPEIDEVAAWTIGGLVAGKVLAKAGILALILKNIKLIGLAVVAIFGGAWKWFKRKTEPETVRDITGGTKTDA